MALSNVDLPRPEGPSRTMNSPSAISTDHRQVLDDADFAEANRYIPSRYCAHDLSLSLRRRRRRARTIAQTRNRQLGTRAVRIVAAMSTL